VRACGCCVDEAGGAVSDASGMVWRLFDHDDGKEGCLLFVCLFALC
jgi:hypothetical protein